MAAAIRMLASRVVLVGASILLVQALAHDPRPAVARYDDSNPPRPMTLEYVETVPASMLTATGSDVARFAIAQLQNGRIGAVRILSERAAADMHRQQFTQDALLPGIALGFWERFQNGERALWHDGDGGGFASLLYLLPDHDTGFFIAFNGRGGGAAREAVLSALLDRYFPDSRTVMSPGPSRGGADAVRRCVGTYVFNRYGHQGLEKLTSLEGQVELRPDSGGTLRFNGKRYRAVSPLHFQRLDGRRRLAFEADAQGRIVHMFTGDPIARVYERVPWYDTTAFQLAGLGFCVAAFLWTVLAWPAAMILRRMRARSSVPGPGRRAEIAAVVLSGLNLVFLVGLGGYLTQSPSQLEFGVPPLFVALLTIPLLSTGIAAALGPLSARAWGHPGASRGARFQYALVTVAAVGFVAWLVNRNLLGYRF